MITSSYQKKVKCQNIPAEKILIFDLYEGYEILHLFTKDLKIKAKRKSGKVSLVIGFFGDGQRKSQYVFLFPERKNTEIGSLVGRSLT